jgi:hypothetical protein
MIEKYIVYLKQQIHKDNIFNFAKLFINEANKIKHNEIEIFEVDKFYEDRIYFKNNDNIISISIRQAYKNNTNFVCLTINKTFKMRYLLDDLLSEIIKELESKFIFKKVSNFKDIIVLQGLGNE